MNYLKSIHEGIENLPVSSYLNWSDLDIEKKRKERSEKYKKYGGKEKLDQKRELKKEIKADFDKIKDLEDPGIYFIEKEPEKLSFFTLIGFYNVRYKSPILDIFKKWEIDPLAAKTHFSIEDRLNRLHFLKGLSPQLRGTGLSEIIYKQIIHHVGWVTSNADAKPGVKILWSKLARDNDFYTIVTYFDVIAISKKKGYAEEEIRQIVYRFLEAKVEDIYKYKGKTEIDPDLIEMFPELKEKYYRKGKTIKRYEKILRKELKYLPFINDSLIINVKGVEEYCLVRDVYFIKGKVFYWCVIRNGHLIITPYIEKGKIGFNKALWKESGGVDKYITLQEDVDVTGIIPNDRNIIPTRRNLSVQELINGRRLTYIPRRTIYNRDTLNSLVFTRTRVKNAIEVRISYDGDPPVLQLIKNHEYYKRIFIAR